jgi:hypothetical protein
MTSTTGAADALTDDDLVKDWKSLSRVLCPVLLRLGVHISSDVVLFTKLCRVLREYIKVGTTSGGEVTKNEAFAVTEHIIVKVLLPGLSVAGCNPGLSQEVSAKRRRHDQRVPVLTKCASSTAMIRCGTC